MSHIKDKYHGKLRLSPASEKAKMLTIITFKIKVSCERNINNVSISW